MSTIITGPVSGLKQVAAMGLGLKKRLQKVLEPVTYNETSATKVNHSS